jgi:hypothetical protein
VPVGQRAASRHRRLLLSVGSGYQRAVGPAGIVGEGSVGVGVSGLPAQTWRRRVQRAASYHRRLLASVRSGYQPGGRAGAIG